MPESALQSCHCSSLVWLSYLLKFVGVNKVAGSFSTSFHGDQKVLLTFGPCLDLISTFVLNDPITSGQQV